jgi:hypothetical protein
MSLGRQTHTTLPSCGELSGPNARPNQTAETSRVAGLVLGRLRTPPLDVVLDEPSDRIL